MNSGTPYQPKLVQYHMKETKTNHNECLPAMYSGLSRCNFRPRLDPDYMLTDLH